MSAQNRANALRLPDAAAACESLTAWMRTTARERRHLGLVVATSGGVDSAVCLGLAARAYGPDRVLALALPDRHSDPMSVDLARRVADTFGTKFEIKPITAVLDAVGCYDLQERAVRSEFPSFDPEIHRFRVVFRQDFASSEAIPDFRLNVMDSVGTSVYDASLRPDPYRLIVAATNVKQRCRMIETHLEAERRGWGVVGTSNRQELEQGFVVRYGDATGDLLPIGNLLKTNVYELARVLRVPAPILERTPTTDTYSAPQTQDEFFYGLPLGLNDILWDAYSRNERAATVAVDVDLTPGFVERVFAAYDRRRRQADRLHGDLADLRKLVIADA